MRVSDSQHFRKTVAGVCMVLAPLMVLVAFAISPPLETSATKQLAAASGHVDRFYISTVAAFVGLALFLGAILGLIHMMRERGTAYGHIGGALACIGLLFTMAGFSGQLMIWLMAKDGVTASDANLLHRFIHSGGVAPFMIVGYLLAVGLVVMAVGLYSARLVDWWMAALVAVGPVLVEVAFPAHALWMAIVGASFMLVGLGSIGLMVLGETDTDWEHTPEYRGFRPAAGLR
jgi:hypothetical protein